MTSKKIKKKKMSTTSSFRRKSGGTSKRADETDAIASEISDLREQLSEVFIWSETSKSQEVQQTSECLQEIKDNYERLFKQLWPFYRTAFRQNNKRQSEDRLNQFMEQRNNFQDIITEAVQKLNEYLAAAIQNCHVKPVSLHLNSILSSMAEILRAYFEICETYEKEATQIKARSFLRHSQEMTFNFSLDLL